MTRLSSRLAFLLFIFLFSCTPILEVKTDFDNYQDFSSIKTFSLYKYAHQGRHISEVNRNRIISEIKENLKRKGLQEVNTNPDIFVNATTIFGNKTNVVENNEYELGGYHRPYYWSSKLNKKSYNAIDYEFGSLIIDVIDSKSKNIIWSSTGNQAIDIPKKKQEKVIRLAVQKMLRNFPPKNDTLSED